MEVEEKRHVGAASSCIAVRIRKSGRLIPSANINMLWPLHKSLFFTPGSFTPLSTLLSWFKKAGRPPHTSRQNLEWIHILIGFHWLSDQVKTFFFLLFFHIWRRLLLEPCYSSTGKGKQSVSACQTFRNIGIRDQLRKLQSVHLLNLILGLKQRGSQVRCFDSADELHSAVA